MKIAFVHDYLNQMGGAENVLEQLCELFPEAPVYTSVINKAKLRPSFEKVDIRHSFMQKLPFIENHFKKYLPLYPFAFEQMKLSGFDVIFSISSGFAKGVSYEKGTFHINYCLTPMRFAWMFKQYKEKENIPFFYLPLLYPLLILFKKWDLEKNRNVHKFVTLSTAVQKRIRNWYGRDSDIIYPPVDVKKFNITTDPKTDYFLVVSRLREYKRIDLAVSACTKLGLPLKVIGTGTAEQKLKKIAGPYVEFLGYKNDEEVVRYVQQCKAFIFPGEEDFGIAPLEAQACGRPVIAFKAGGALDTVIENETGIFFEKQTEKSLIEAINNFKRFSFIPEKCRSNALRFDNEHFKDTISKYIEKSFVEYKSKQSQK